MLTSSKANKKIAIAVFAICSIIGIIAVSRFLDPFDDRPYDRSSWLTSDRQERAAMAQDALKLAMKPGMSIDDVVNALGEPDEKIQSPTDGGGNPMEGNVTYSYYLGTWSGYSYDSTFLYIHMDEQGEVLSAEINGY